MSGFFHLCHIEDVPLCELFKLLVVDIRTVEGHNLVVHEMAGSEHEKVIGCGRSELNVTIHALIGMDDGMNLYAAFLPPRLRMTPNTFENHIGEQRYRGRVNDSQTF